MLLGVVIDSDAVALFGLVLAAVNAAIVVLFHQLVQAKNDSIAHLKAERKQLLDVILRHGLPVPDPPGGGTVGGRPG